jgi:hypothetical protein
MKKTILALTIAMLSGTALAVNYGTPGNNPGNPGNNGVGGPPISNPGNGGQGGQGGNGLGVGTGIGVAGAAAGAIAGAASSSGGNSQTINVAAPAASTSSRLSGGYDLRTTGIAPDMISSPTAPCRIGVGISGGWVGGALGIGGSTLDEGCELRENARLLNNLGKPQAAVALLCNDAKVAKVLPECAAPVTGPTGSQVSYNPATRTTTVRELNGFNH